ncbi:MAG: DUF4149 domain-containing protein [Gracilimonas sp.]|uniref:DUF4149 domain-containing protein n=1 Tax=Gracilimonas sp. TaxID=1974203 RepID=UPI0019AFFF04|nr:DUF4149 domain-containing protein [Gracilimonas sp.]MBD3615056.1 DUF4149 domain-containing protein [Gracilimonas sp.]
MYYLSLFIHILSAIFWIGGMLFTVAVLVPASREPLLNKHRGAFFKLIGEKFSRISWLLFMLLIITGVTNLTTRGFDWKLFLDQNFWSAGFGYYLGIKLIIFSIVLLISGVHDFYAGPKAAELMESEPNSILTQKFRKLSSWLGRINLIFGLLILYYAIRVVRG